ncbi:hypothetical protein Droror1_Dr00004057 [Drosera rotundifolia]
MVRESESVSLISAQSNGVEEPVDYSYTISVKIFNWVARGRENPCWNNFPGDMRSDYVLPKKANPSLGGVPPSLVDLCVQKAIDNVRYIGNVGELDSHLLERILPHCKVEQLMHIENCTEGRDLSCVTNNLWKTFYEKEFGIEHTKVVIERMRKQNCSFSWRLLYQAKLKYRDDVKNKSVERLTELYKEADAKKQSRQIKICSKAPPSFKRRGFSGGFGSSYNVSNVKSNIMKKVKVDFLNSTEVRNRAAMKKVSVQRKPSSSSTPRGLPTMLSGSTSKPQRKF